MAVSNRRYTPAQKDAMLALAEQGVTSTEISRQLETVGYPPLEVGPISVPASSIRAMVSRLRAQRASWTQSPLAGADPSEAVRELMRRQISIGERETARMARLQAKGKMRATDYKAMATALNQLAQAAGRLPRGPTTPSTEPDPGTLASSLDEDDTEQDNPATPANGNGHAMHVGPATAGPATTQHQDASTATRPDNQARADESNPELDPSFTA